MANNQKLIIFNYVQCDHNQKGGTFGENNAKSRAEQAESSTAIAKGFRTNTTTFLALLKTWRQQISLSHRLELGCLLDMREWVNKY